MKFLQVLLVLMALTALRGAETPVNKTFVATHEWQEIKDDYFVPSGLHIRMNLSTKKREGKLLSRTDEEAAPADKKSAVAVTADKDPLADFKERKLTKTIRKVLKEVPAERLFDGMERPKAVKQKPKDPSDFFKDSSIGLKDDPKIISNLIKEYVELSEPEENIPAFRAQQAAKLRVLESLSFMVHQIDNALWFIKTSGLQTILLPLIVNQTDTTLKVQALQIVGALTQNNPDAKVKVFELNFASYIAQILITSTSSEELSAGLYSFGSIVRKFPLAQKSVLASSGMHALVAVLDKECDLKVKAKAMNLIGDMIVEQLQAPMLSDADAIAQYKDIHILNWLAENHYCETLDAAVRNKLYAFLESPDLVESFVQGMDVTRDLCASVWGQSPELRHVLLTLRNRFQRSEDEYRQDVSRQMELLTNALYPSKPLPHIEL